MEATTTERDLMAEIIRNPELMENIDTQVLDTLAGHADTRSQFFQMIANPLLREVPTPDGIRLALEADGEKQLNELHLHVECDDFSPLVIVEVEELARLSALDMLSDDKKREFFGIIAKAIQTAVQNGNIVSPEQGKKNAALSRGEKERILNEIAESLLA